MATRKRYPQAQPGALVVALPYGRVSTREQGDEGLSLPNQQARIVGYIGTRGWVAGDWKQDVESGTKPERAGYQDLLTEVRALREAGRPVAVVVARLDRLGRKAVELLRVRDELRDLGVSIHSVREGGEMSDVMWGILATLAQEESRRLGERVSDVVEATQGNGWHFPGRVPWGYRLRPATDAERGQGAPRSVLDVDDATAPYVRELFERAANGEALRSLARWAAGLPASARGDRNVNYSVVWLMLRNPVYAGRRKSDSAPARWPALIDAETFDAVQTVLRRLPAQPARQASQRYLLTGYVWCPNCGARMAGHGHHGKYRNYVCASADRGAGHAERRCYCSVSADKLDRAVLAEVEPIILAAPRIIRAELETVARLAQAEQPPDPLDARIADLERERDDARATLANLTGLLASRKITETAYSAAAEAQEREYHAAISEIERLQGERVDHQPLDLATLVQSADFWREQWAQADVAGRRMLLSEYIVRVVPVRGPGRQGPVTVQISWTVTGELVRELLRAESNSQVA